MPQATDTPITSRRTLFGAAAALSVAALPAAAFAAGDADLIALHRALVEQTEELRRIMAEPLPPGITPESLAHEERLADADDIWFEIADRLSDTRAVSPGGLRIKADALRIVLEGCVCIVRGHTIADIDEDGEVHERLSWSLARDVLAGRV